jgi:prevent-host-death family protein
MSATRTWSAKEARQHFADVLDAAQSGTPQRISRRGKASFLVVAEADWNRKQTSDAGAAKFVKHLLAFPGLDDDFLLPRGEADRPVAGFDQEEAG